MGKHYTIEFKLQVLQPILNEKMSIREAARFYNIPSNALVGTWLKRFSDALFEQMISTFINTSFILGAIVFGLALSGLLFYRQKPVM
ncbi:MAG: hypothetical protein KH422_04845 [Haemophilus parainfluenzae]|nr:hypothetical protein [Haemophilus parainfluenzae]